MLPSKGEFSSINCPFYDSGLCERPFCHFRHVTKRVPMLVDGDEKTKLVAPPPYTPTPLAELSRLKGGARRHIPVVACTSISVYHPTMQRKRRHAPSEEEPYWKLRAPAVTPPPAGPSYNFYIGGGMNSPPLLDVTTIVRRAKESLSAPDSVFGRRKPLQQAQSYYGSNTADDDTPESDTVGFYDNNAEAGEIDTLNTNKDLPASVSCNAKEKQVANKLNYFGFEANLEEADEIDTLNTSKVISAGVYSDEKERETANKLNDIGFDENFTEAKEIEIQNTTKELLANVYWEGKEKEGENKVSCLTTPISTSQLITETDTPKKSETRITEETLSPQFNHGLSLLNSGTICKDNDSSHSEDKSKHRLSDTKLHKRHSDSSTTKHSNTTSSSQSKSRSKNNRHSSSKHKKSSTEYKSSSHNKIEKNKREATGAKEDPSSHSEVSSKNKKEAMVKKEPTTKVSVGDRVSPPWPPVATPPERERQVEELRVAPPNHKKRVAHGAALGLRTMALQKRPVPNPFLAMARRYEAAKKGMNGRERGNKIMAKGGVASPGDVSNVAFHLPCSLQLDKMRSLAGRLGAKKAPATGTDTNPSSGGGNRVRIAHVPNVDKLLQERENVRRYVDVRRNLLERRERRAEAMRHHDEHVARTMTTTPARTAPKGASGVARRQAHVARPAPQDDRPTIVPQPNAKVPVFARQRKLNSLVDEYLMVHEKREAYRLAVKHELDIYGRSTSLMTYSSLVASAVLAIRHTIEDRATKFRAEVLGIEMKPPPAPEAKGAGNEATIYAALRKFVLTESQLVENGFPRMDPEREGSAVVKLRYGYDGPVVPSRRRCARCGSAYEVNARGLQTSEGSCLYHEQGRPHKGQYRCCDGDLDSPGCRVAASHVCDNFRATNYGFCRTQDPDRDHGENHGVYAVDCEMSYTTLGVELTRVTVVGRDCKTVYDSFVRPDGLIVDYNTRFSGVTEADMEGVNTSLADVQEKLSSFVDGQTILVGHSLDSDLRALKLIHNTCVDTSVVYPHPDGGGKKRALRTLVRRMLRRTIQQGEGGHDSAEDAIAAMELMLHKIGVAVGKRAAK